MDQLSPFQTRITRAQIQVALKKHRINRQFIHDFVIFHDFELDLIKKMAAFILMRNLLRRLRSS